MCNVEIKPSVNTAEVQRQEIHSKRKSSCVNYVERKTGTHRNLNPWPYNNNYGYLKYLVNKCIRHLFLLIQTRTIVNG